jgi:hypothetical protein
VYGHGAHFYVDNFFNAQKLGFIEQFQPMLRGDHLAGPKPIELMEPFTIGRMCD